MSTAIGLYKRLTRIYYNSNYALSDQYHSIMFTTSSTEHFNTHTAYNKYTEIHVPHMAYSGFSNMDIINYVWNSSGNHYIYVIALVSGLTDNEYFGAQLYGLKPRRATTKRRNHTSISAGDTDTTRSILHNSSALIGNITTITIDLRSSGNTESLTDVHAILRISPMDLFFTVIHL